MMLCGFGATHFYDGNIGGGRTLPTGALLSANVSVQSWIDPATTLWVTPEKILGDDLAFSLTTPFGEPRVDADLLVNSRRLGPTGLSVTFAETNMSDFFLNSFVGWQSGEAEPR
jgi:hypothetical protein